MAMAAAALLTLLVMGVLWSTGYFAVTVFFTVLIVLTRTATSVASRRRVIDLAGLALVLGSVGSFSSGNGLHNFGVSAAAVMPFLMLHCSRDFGETAAGQALGWMGHAVAPTLALLFVVNGAWLPYRELPVWHPFERVQGIPAFRGIAASAEKVRILSVFAGIGRSVDVRGRRLLVAGPHPWLYFAWEAQPVTSMVYMHYSGTDATHAIAAARLFSKGEPDSILITNQVPSAIAARLEEWSAKGCTAHRFTLRPGFLSRYEWLVNETLLPELVVLRREPRTPR